MDLGARAGTWPDGVHLAAAVRGQGRFCGAAVSPHRSPAWSCLCGRPRVYTAEQARKPACNPGGRARSEINTSLLLRFPVHIGKVSIG